MEIGEGIATTMKNDVPGATRLGPDLRALSMPVLAVDGASLRILDANAATTREFGWPHAALVTMRLPDIRPPADGQMDEQAATDGSTPRPPSGAWRILGADGRVRETQAIVSDMPGQGGAVLLVSAMGSAEAAQPVARASEARLVESEERLRLAMAAAGIGTFRRDILADRFDLSPEARRLHGLLAEGDVSLDDWLAAAPEEDRAQVIATLQEGWSRRAYEIPAQYRLVDRVTGAVRHIESRALYTYDEAGRPVSSIGIVIDITDRKERELALTESEQRYRSIIDTAADAIIIADDAGRILSANPATLQMFGYASGAELIGSDLGILMPEEDARAHPAYVMAHRRGQPPRVIGQPGRQLMGRRADGSTFPMELSVGSFRVGEAVYLTGIVRDTTKREAVQRALLESEERLRLAQEASGIGIWEYDVAAGTVHLSAHSLAMHELPPDHPADFPRDQWAGFVNPDDAEEVRRQTNRAVATGEPIDAVFRVYLKNGGVRWLQSRGRVLPSNTGRPHRLHGVNIDVTARHELAEQLRHSEETLRLALEATDQGLWDWDIPSGRSTFSDRHCRMRGYEPHEVSNTVSFWEDTVHPDDLRTVRAKLEAHLAGEAPFYASEYRVRRRDGSEIWVADRGKIVERDAAGRPVRMVGTNQDITARIAMESAFTENARWLRLAQDASGIGIFTVDFTAGTVRFSANSRRLHGMPDNHPEVFPRSEWPKWVVEEDVVEARARLGSTDERIEFNFRVRLPEGRFRWVQAVGRHVPADGNGGDRFIGVHMDVTERRELLEKLQRSEETQRLAMETSGAGIWVYDIASATMALSERAAQMLGETPESFGRDAQAYTERLHPDDVAWFNTVRDERLSGRVPRFSSQYRMRHRDGHWVWMMVRGKPIDLDSEGRAQRVIGVLLDISAMKAAETALARSEAQLRSVIDAVPLGIAVVDSSSEILIANPACLDMLGAASPGDVVGCPLREYLESDEGLPWAADAVPVDGPQTRLNEVTLRRPGRPELRAECVVVPLVLGERRHGFLAVLTDVTRQRDAAAQLRSMEAQALRSARMSAVGSMAAALAHQLNQPLSAATNYTKAGVLMLRQSGASPAAVEQPIALLEKSAQQILKVGAIIRGLREFIGNDQNELATIRVQDLLAEIVRDVEAHHPQAADAAIAVSVLPSNLSVHGDAALLSQLLSNLIRNGLEATAKSPVRRVEVSARLHADGREVEIVVRDTGPGIPPALRRRLFDPVTSSKPDGMGIGLAIVRAIAELHGGSIQATDSPVGQGAEFRLLLPPTGDALVGFDMRDC